MDRQSAGKRLVHEGRRDRTSPQENGLEPGMIRLFPQQPGELGRDERDVRGAEAGDGLTEWSLGLRKRDRRPSEQAPEQYGKASNVIERQRMEPPVAGPERDVSVRAERIVVVVAEGVERRLRDTGAPRGEYDGRGALQRDARTYR